jgi:hypothetical protein
MIETGGYRPSEEIAAALKAPELADLATVREEIAGLRREIAELRAEVAGIAAPRLDALGFELPRNRRDVGP